jgi:hypothetical protein
MHGSAHGTERCIARRMTPPRHDHDCIERKRSLGDFSGVESCSRRKRSEQPQVEQRMSHGDTAMIISARPGLD